jgi:UDP-N-acetylmuramoylalanine--D-glutamate ligase
MPLRTVVVGLGQTGYSVARFLLARGSRVAVTDSRPEPPELRALVALGGDVLVRTGGFDAALLEHADLVVVSPGWR